MLILVLWAHLTYTRAAGNRGGDDLFLPMELYQLDHTGVCARIQEECGHCLPVTMQRCQQRDHYVVMLAVASIYSRLWRVLARYGWKG